MPSARKRALAYLDDLKKLHDRTLGTHEDPKKVKETEGKGPKGPKSPGKGTEAAGRKGPGGGGRLSSMLAQARNALNAGGGEDADEQTLVPADDGGRRRRRPLAGAGG